MNHLSMISSFLRVQLIIFFFFFFMDYVKAQNPSYPETTGIRTPDSPNNFQPSLAVVIGMLSVMFSLTFILLLYAKFCHTTSSSTVMGQQIRDGLVRSRSAPTGVDKTVVESLPFFRFSSLKGSKEGLECSVCLAKFEDIEILRLLPKCKHAFHMNCIDQWLEKHSTCPLCRRKVSADDLSQLPYSTSLRFLWNNQSELREESNIELYVEREERNLNGSSRFSIGSSFRKTERCNDNNNNNIKEEELPIQQSMDCEEHKKPLHKFNHTIVVSDVVLKNRWSNVSSSDLMFLSSEMINDVSSARFSPLDSRIDQKSAEISENGEMINIKQEMERKRVFENKIREIKQSDSYFLGISTTSVSEKQNSLFESKALNQNEKRSMSEIVVHPRFTEMRNRDSCVAEINVQEERMRRIWLPIARKTVQWFANRERRHPPSQGFHLQRLNV